MDERSTSEPTSDTDSSYLVELQVEIHIGVRLPEDTPLTISDLDQIITGAYLTIGEFDIRTGLINELWERFTPADQMRLRAGDN